MPRPFSEPVHEYASPDLVAVRPTETLDAVARLLEERGISGVAVTEADGTLRGIVSTKDVLRAVALEIHPRSPHPVVRSTDRTAAEVMIAKPITVGVDEAIRRAAALMVEHGIHRVIVKRGDRPVGVVTTRDVMRAVLRHRITTPLRQVMRMPVETIDIGQPVEQAVAHLADANVRGLVVVDDGWPVGVFTHTEAIQVARAPLDAGRGDDELRGPVPRRIDPPRPRRRPRRGDERPPGLRGRRPSTLRHRHRLRSRPRRRGSADHGVAAVRVG
jgi:CBS domain-containing protein